MSKQDGYASRTAADLERKYNFGQTFAEVYGLVADARKAAEEAQNAFDGLDQEAIFNLLTNYGQAQGVYRDDDGNVYVNASFIRVGGISDDSLLDIMATQENLKKLESAFSVSQEGVASTIQKLQKDVEGYSGQVSDFEQTVEGFNATVAEYSGAVAGYKTELASLTEQVGGYETAIREYDAQVVSFDQTVEGFRSSVQGYDAAVLEYSGNLTALNAQVEAYAKDVVGYEAAVNGYEGAVRDYSAQVSNFSQTVDGFNTTVLGYMDTVAGYTAEYSAINQTASKIEASVSAVSGADGKVTAASIVAAINNTSGESIVRINADNIVMTGTTTFAKTSDIPKKYSQLKDDMGTVNTTNLYMYGTQAGFVDKNAVTTITNDTISTTNVVAQNLKVKGANIEGTLTIGSLPDEAVTADNFTKHANQGNYMTFQGVATLTDQLISVATISADQIYGGTITGIELISEGLSWQKVHIANGQIETYSGGLGDNGIGNLDLYSSQYLTLSSNYTYVRIAPRRESGVSGYWEFREDGIFWCDANGNTVNRVSMMGY